MRHATAFLLLVLLMPLSAQAVSLAQAKAQGLVEETADGYLASRVTNAEVNALVNATNNERRAEYERRARQTGTPRRVAEEQAGALQAPRPEGRR